MNDASFKVYLLAIAALAFNLLFMTLLPTGNFAASLFRIFRLQRGFDHVVGESLLG